MEKCIEHPKEEENYFCYNCFKYFCGRCSNIHIQENKDHTSDHIDDIKEKLTNFYLNNSVIDNNVNGSKNKSLSLQHILDSLWSSIKELSLQYLEINKKNVELNDDFNNIINELINQQHKLEKPLISDLEQLEELIQDRMSELNNLRHLLFLTFKYNRNFINNQEILKLKDININNTNYTTNHEKIDSINNSQQLNLFIQNNLDYIDKIEKGDLNKNNIDSKFKEELQKFIINNNKNNNKEIPTLINNYDIIKNSEEIDIFKSLVSKALKVINKNRKPYIFSSNCNGITLIDINNDNQLIKPTTSDFCNLKGTFNSMVMAEDKLYIFGGNEHNSKYYILCCKTNTIEEGDISIDGGNGISTCYDGKDHIYLINGCETNRSQVSRMSQLSRIDKFNIREKTFSRCLKFDNCFYHKSFFYDGALYSLPFKDDHPKLHIYKPFDNKLASYHDDELSGNVVAVCSDNHGNLYIHSGAKTNFKRFNLRTKEMVSLTTLNEIDDASTMVYHEKSRGESVIYLFGKKGHNYIYSIKKNEWTNFSQLSDGTDRCFYGASLIYLNNNDNIKNNNDNNNNNNNSIKFKKK